MQRLRNFVGNMEPEWKHGSISAFDDDAGTSSTASSNSDATGPPAIFSDVFSNGSDPQPLAQHPRANVFQNPVGQHRTQTRYVPAAVINIPDQFSGPPITSIHHSHGNNLFDSELNRVADRFVDTVVY